jgi:hypothetical protein
MSIEDITPEEKSRYDFVLWNIVYLQYQDSSQIDDIHSAIKLYNKTINNVFQLNKGILQYVIYVESLDITYYEDIKWYSFPVKTSIGFDWNSDSLNDVITLYSSLRSTQLKFANVRRTNYSICPKYLELYHVNAERKIMREEIMNLRHFDVNINTFCEVLNINKRYKRNKLQHRYKDINDKIKSLSKKQIILFP